MPHRSHRSHTTTGGRRSFGVRSERDRAALPWLVAATDACLWMTLVGVTVCFGGRAAVGQLVLVTGAALTTLCWLLHLLTKREPSYHWTGTEWLWLAGIGVGASQLIPLPRNWLLAISPRMERLLLPEAVGKAIGVSTGSWSQLSLIPWETASGLATFVAYALLFWVVTQRVRTIADVERMLSGLAVTAVCMAIFAQLQFLTSNGKFFWFHEHPFATTNIRPTGSFTNRNHLAQFLALGIGPLVWWVTRTPNLSSSGDEPHAARNLFGFAVVLIGLGLTILTGLSTLSRGGLVAVGVATTISVGVLWRLGRIPATVCVGLVIAVAAMGAALNLSGIEGSLTNRLSGASGRDEIWRANIEVARDFPLLGTGVGTHVDAHHLHLEQPIEGSEFTHAESGYLQVLSETGLIGLGLAAFFMAISLWQCGSLIRSTDERVRVVAAVVMAGLMANLSQSLGDFIWYTPSCVLMLTIQLACVCRLYSSSGEVASAESHRHATHPRVSVFARLGIVSTLVATVAIGAWMVDLKLPSTLAETEQRQAALIALAKPSFYADDEDRQAAQDERRQATIRAARLNPRDSRLQEAAAMAYVEWFNERQERAENPLPLGHLRDAIQASEFESPAALRAWLKVAVGKNVILLRAASKYLGRALEQSPLRAASLLQLAELGCINGLGNDVEVACRNQAVTLRPHDPDVLFAVGREALLKGDHEQAMKSWQVAFSHSRRWQATIAETMPGRATPEEAIEILKPDWAGIGVLAQAYSKAEFDAEANQLWERYLDAGKRYLQSSVTDQEYESAMLSLRMAYLARNERDQSIRLLSHGLKRLPQSIPLRKALGGDLLDARRNAEAADHLVWCAARLPDDTSLQQAAARAVKERLKSESLSADRRAVPSLGDVIR